MEVIRCDNCKKDIDDSEQRFIVRVRQGEYATVIGAPDRDFCSVKCVAEFYGGSPSEAKAEAKAKRKPWPK